MQKIYKYKIGPELDGRVHMGNTLCVGMIYSSEVELTGPGFNIVTDPPAQEVAPQPVASKKKTEPRDGSGE